MLRLRQFAAKTHQGPFLESNEDDVEIDLKDKVFYLSDGFGGASIGDECVKLAKGQIKMFYSRASKDKNATMPFFYSPKYSIEANAFINGMYLAHKKILEFNAPKPMNSRGGVSLVAAIQSENLVTLVSIGNCSVFFSSIGKLSKVIQSDDLSNLSNDYKNRHRYTCPMSGLGLFEHLNFQTAELRPKTDDMILMLSDGIHAYLEDHEISSVLNSRSSNLTQKIDNMMNLANSRGNQDNQSTVLLHF